MAGRLEQHAQTASMGRAAVNWNRDNPRGFMGSVIICWWPTEMKTCLPESPASGMGYSVVMGRLWTI